MIGPGTRLSHYEVISRIGATGIGEVYRVEALVGEGTVIRTLVG